MTTDTIAAFTDVALARHVADEAARLLRAIRHDGHDGARGDREANRLILDLLHAHRPDDAILSEEAADDLTRLSSKRVWIVDPLDGTREFGEGRADWAVHVGLAIDHHAISGAGALPALNETMCSDAPRTFEIAPIPHHPRVLVSRSRPAAEALAVAEAIGGVLVPMGSAGAKAMAVVRGDAEIYLHSGGQYEWDNCAPAAVAAANGLHVSRIDGSPMRYNNADPYLPDLLICRPELANRVLAIVERLND